MQLTHAQRNGINRGDAMREYVRRNGYTPAGHKTWDEAEVSLLARHWPNLAAIRAALPHRSSKAIERKADRLRLPTIPRHWWTAAEASRFRRLWPVASKRELLEAFPWASWKALSKLAERQRRNGYPGLTRPPFYPVPAGDDFIDAVLERVIELNLCLKDLDAMARSGRYFRSGQYRRQRNWRHLARAVEALGGDLKTVFVDDWISGRAASWRRVHSR